MRLLEALKAARQTISGDRNDAIHRHVLLDLDSAREHLLVYTSDGEVTTEYQVDSFGLAWDDPIHIAVSMDQVAPMLTQAVRVHSLQFVQGGAALKMAVCCEEGQSKPSGAGTLNVLPATQFKMHAMPDWPADVMAWDRNEVGDVADFVGDDPAAPAYNYVQAHPDGVQASDMKSAATVSTAVPWDGTFSAGLLRGWPKRGPFCAAHTPLGALYGIEGQRRFAAYARVPSLTVWNRLSPGVPTDTSWCVVDTKAFTAAVKQATKCSKLGVLWLTHREDGILACAETDGGGHAFNARVAAVRIRGTGECPMAFAGSRVLAVLKAVRTPCVMLSMPHANAPLRLEAGRMVAAVWRVEFAGVGTD